MDVSLESRAKIVCEAVAQTGIFDALVTDRNPNVLAASGIYFNAIGKKCHKNSNAERVIDSPSLILVKEPKQESQCYNCKGQKNCIFSKPLLISSLECNESSFAGALVLVASHTQAQQVILNASFMKLSAVMGEFTKYISSLFDLRGTIDYDSWIFNLSQCLDILTDKPGLLIDDERNIVIPSPRFLQLVKNNSNQPAYTMPILNNHSKSLVSSTESIATSESLFGSINFINNTITFMLGRKNFFKGYQVYLPHLSPECKNNHIDNTPLDYIVGNSPLILSLKENCARAAVTDLPVLIQGETGTGKELVGQAIHHASQRRAKTLVAVNVAAIPDHLFESEFFGYEEGSFTGAKRGGKQGKVELANGGTLFLDEIAEMPLLQQPKLLRVLETGYVERLGGQQSKPVNLRIISATNRDLDELLAKGLFREDLYHRLNAIIITIPPLRSHKEDIPLLIQHFLELCFQKYGIRKHIHRDTVGYLMDYEWPGNVRELRNTIEVAYCMSDKYIMPDCILPRINKKGESLNWTSNNDLITIDLRKHAVEAIKKALSQYGTSVQGKKFAAKSLGISLATLYRWIKQYNLDQKRKK